MWHVRSCPFAVVAASALLASTAEAQTAFFTREATTGLTKQCFYDYSGSAYTRTIRSVDICPLSIQVETPAPTGGGNIWSAIARGLADAARARRENALREKEIAALEEQAAYLRSRRMLDSLNVINAVIEQKRAEEQRQEQQWNVYQPRARYSLQKALDSAVPAFDSARAHFWRIGAERLTDLFFVTPEATNAQMADVLEPLIAEYAPRYRRTVEQGRALLATVADSLKLTGEARTRFTNAAAERLLAVINTDTALTIGAPFMRDVIDPVVDSIRRARLKTRRPPPKRPSSHPQP